MDRPRQIARALRRTLAHLGRETLDTKLVVWPGPPIADVAAHPETLVGLVTLAGADTVVIDSIKDAAVGLSNDEVGAGYNRARQMCIAEGIEVLELHHMIKKGEGGAAPTTLADMYGSVWIGAGAGSVLNLHGAAGDPIVTMRQLKTPSEEVGPYQLRHDHEAGTTEIHHSTDLLALVRLQGPSGITAKTAASAIENKDKPSAAAVEKARRRLDKLTRSGHLDRIDGAPASGVPTKWVWVSDTGLNGLVNPHDTPHGREADVNPHDHTEPSRSIEIPTSQPHDNLHDPHDANPHVSHPPFKGGGNEGETTPPPGYIRRVIAGEQLYVNPTTGEVQP